jgi:hypothetical protein
MKKLLPFLLLFGIACTKAQLSQNNSSSMEQKPEEAVKSFVELSATAKLPEDKKKLLAFTGGSFRSAFERLSEEEFKLTYLSGQIKIEKLEIVESSSDKDKARVHYRVSIENEQGTEVTHETSEREVELQKENGSWTIQVIHLMGSDKLAFTRGMMF